MQTTNRYPLGEPVSLTKTGLHVVFTRFNHSIMEIFKRSHMLDDVARENFHNTRKEAFAHAWDLIVADGIKEQENRDQGKQGSE